MPEWYTTYFDNLQYNGFKNSWHLFVILIKPDRLKINRDCFIEELKCRGIGTSVHFIPLHLQPYYADKYDYHTGDFPNSEMIFERVVSLPLYPKLSEEQIIYIINAIRDILEQFRL